MSSSNNPFDDEDVVLKALAELLDGSFERTSRLLKADSAMLASGDDWNFGNRSAAPEALVNKLNGINSTEEAGWRMEGSSVRKVSTIINNESSAEPVPVISPERDKPLLSRQESSFLEEDDSFSASFAIKTDDSSPRHDANRFRDSESSGAAVQGISGEDEELTQEKLELLYQCPICLEVPRGVIQETSCCSQLFCDACIRDALNAISDKSCPFCRGDAKLNRNESVENIISNARMKLEKVPGPVAPSLTLPLARAVNSTLRTESATLELPPRPPRSIASATANNPQPLEQGQWSCARCTLFNAASSEVCEACNFPSPKPLVDQEFEEPMLPSPRNTALSRNTQTSKTRTREKLSLSQPVPDVKERRPSQTFQVKCPFCDVQLHVPESLSSPNEPFRCGSCWNKIAVPSANPSASQRRLSSASVPPSTMSPKAVCSTGSVMLKIATGTLIRKDRWKHVTWRIDSHGLSFVDKSNCLLRRIHIHPFMAFTQVSERRASSKPGSTFYLAKMVENPRSALARSTTAVRGGTFSTKLPVKELCEVASEAEASGVVDLIEAVERAIKLKRSTMAGMPG